MHQYFLFAHLIARPTNITDGIAGTTRNHMLLKIHDIGDEIEQRTDNKIMTYNASPNKQMI